MAIKKQFVKTKPVCKVTFQLAKEADEVAVMEILTIGTEKDFKQIKKWDI
jgi:hypothetical protein